MARFTRDPHEVAEVLRSGGIAVYPTETFYGLGAVATASEALERLVASKLRPPGKALPLIACDRDMAFSLWKSVPEEAIALARRFWPGPLTLVLEAAPGLLPEVTGEGTVGVRVPGSAVARELSRRCRAPLVSTSANLSGGPPVARVEDLDPALLARVDAVLDGGPVAGGLPSTVVEVRAGRLRLLRAGALPWAEIQDSVTGGSLPFHSE